MLGRLVLLISFAASGIPVLGAAAETFELRGKVVLPGGESIKEAVPLAVLEGSNFPFSSRTLVQRSGDFKIGKLRPGSYRLTIVVHGWGHMTASLDIGPGTADDRNRVRRTFEFVPQKDTDGGGTVTPEHLQLPNDALRRFAKAEKRLEKHDTEGAVRELETLLQRYPDFPAAWNRLGTIAFLTERYRDAEEYFSRALQLDPDLYAPLVNIAAVYLNLGRIDLALETNRRCVELRPDDPLAWSQLGQTLFVLGRLDEALDSLGRTRALDPAHNSAPQLVMAEIYRRRSDYARYVELLEEFLRLHPDHPGRETIRQLISAVPPEAGN